MILSRWNPVFADIPVESLVFQHQNSYYQAIEDSTQGTDAAPFIEFMLERIYEAIVASEMSEPENNSVAGHENDPVSDPLARLLPVLAAKTLGIADLMRALGLSHRPTFRKNYLNPALADGWIERTQPESPNSPTQQYRLSS